MAEKPSCPTCGGRNVVGIGATRAASISVTGDFKCNDCGTIWAPPMPRWAGAVFLVLCGVLFLGDLAYLLVALATASIGFAFICGVGLAFLLGGGVYGSLRVLGGKARKAEILQGPNQKSENGPQAGNHSGGKTE